MTLKAFTMPKWGIEMSEGMIGEWSIAEGQDFAKGDILGLIETDKITNEVEAEKDGKFVRLIAQEGETHQVGALLGVLGDGSESAEKIDAFIASFKQADTQFEDDDAAPAETAAPEPAPEPVDIPDTVAISPAAREAAEKAGLDVTNLDGNGRGGRIMLQDVHQALAPKADPELKGPYEAAPGSTAYASPMARRLAAKHGVNLDGLAGTGPRGRICKDDILAKVGGDAPSTAPAADGDVEIVEMTPMRKAIAKRLTQAWQEIPHFVLRRRVRADLLLKAREAAGKKASINDYVTRACALALMEVPGINIQVHGTKIHRLPHADISIAVATDKGLVTPVLRGADLLTVEGIAKETKKLVEKARAAKLRPEDMEGGSFSISNLGPWGVEQFDAIVNPPQAAILAVGSAVPETIDAGGGIAIVPMMHVSLSCDHRAIDGADGAQFLAVLADLFEHPERL